MKVTLVGAGPFDRELMTIKGMRAIKNADVVVYDRLIGEEIISMIPKLAEKINVGKASSNHPIPQDEINEILLNKAKMGLNVVRLKGGDPFLFGRGGEEVEFLKKNNIEFEVIPGISSFLGASSYSGIPITHRDFTSSVHIITGHEKKDREINIDFESLVKLNGTLIFFMSIGTIDQISSGLLKAGMDKNMPACVIERATSSKQREIIGTIETLPDLLKENKIISPSLIIVGKVCSLSEKLNWFKNMPLKNLRVLVTRAKDSQSKLIGRLKELGADAIEFSCIKIMPLTSNNKPLDDSLKNISIFDWLVFTSINGVNIFFDYLFEIEFDIRKLHGLKIAACGIETKKELKKRGILCDFVPDKYDGGSLGNGLVDLIKNGERVLLLRAKKASDEILNIFNKNKISYDDVCIYHTEYEKNEDEFISKMIKNGEIDYVTFTSASTVEGFVKSASDLDFKLVNGICIGEKTAKIAREYGMNTFVSKEATINSMIEYLKEINSND